MKHELQKHWTHKGNLQLFQLSLPQVLHHLLYKQASIVAYFTYINIVQTKYFVVALSLKAQKCDSFQLHVKSLK